MSILDKAIKEMKSYGDMGLPDGENGGGMGSENPVVNAYRMNNILRRRNQAEEEEMNIDGGMRDADMPDGDEARMDDKDYGMDMDMDMPPGDHEEMDNEVGLGMDDDVDTEEMRSFFQDNPAPSDDEVMQYAEERGMDMEQMRQEVYALIQSLLGGEDPVGDGEENMDYDEQGMDDEDMGDEIEFSAPMGGKEDEYDVRDEEEEARAPANRDRMRNMLNAPSERDSNRPGLGRAKQRNNRRARSQYGLGHSGGRKLGENSQ